MARGRRGSKEPARPLSSGYRSFGGQVGGIGAASPESSPRCAAERMRGLADEPPRPAPNSPETGDAPSGNPGRAAQRSRRRGSCASMSLGPEVKSPRNYRRLRHIRSIALDLEVREVTLANQPRPLLSREHDQHQRSCDRRKTAQYQKTNGTRPMAHRQVHQIFRADRRRSNRDEQGGELGWTANDLASRLALRPLEQSEPRQDCDC